jgi:hypothetical protein
MGAGDLEGRVSWGLVSVIVGGVGALEMVRAVRGLVLVCVWVVLVCVVLVCVWMRLLPSSLRGRICVSYIRLFCLWVGGCGCVHVVYVSMCLCVYVSMCLCVYVCVRTHG